MPRYVGLLRGVNVGGRNTLAMAELRSLVEALGHTDVSTFIQSGNVIFTAAHPVGADSLRAAIRERTGLDVAVMLRTRAALERVVDANPFPDADPATLHVGFLGSRVPASVLAPIEPESFLPERFALRGAELYLELPAGMARTRLPAVLERRLKAPLTLRNWKTLTRLLELARG